MLRYLSGKARGLRILLSYGKDEQRRQTGWIAAQTWEIILARALGAVKESSDFTPDSLLFTHYYFQSRFKKELRGKG